MNKAVVYFGIPIKSLEDKAEVKAANNFLVQQILDYAAALEKDPNALLLDVQYITKTEDLLTRVDNPVSVHLAELMAQRTDKINKEAKVEKVRKPDPKEVDLDEPPRVKTLSQEDLRAAQAAAKVAVDSRAKSLAAKPTVASTVKVVEKAVVVVKNKATEDTEDVTEKILSKIFVDMKRSDKTAAILTAFIRAGKDLTVPELVKAAKYEKADIANWLSQTGKKIPAIEKVDRGVYRLNVDKV